MKTLKKALVRAVFVILIIMYIRITDFGVRVSEDEKVFYANSQITLKQCKDAGEKIRHFIANLSEKGREFLSKLTNIE